MLLHFAPGAPREPYFETLKAVGDGLKMTPDERDASWPPTTTTGCSRPAQLEVDGCSSSEAPSPNGPSPKRKCPNGPPPGPSRTPSS